MFRPEALALKLINTSLEHAAKESGRIPHLVSGVAKARVASISQRHP
jgi:hypothetical protein